MNPLISICIPTYNRAHLISDAIDSAINQSYTNIEIIIVDNNSNDNSWELFEKYSKQDKRIKVYKNESNLGPVKNWQKGFEHCSGEYFVILWSDDILNPFFIEKTYSKFDSKTAFVVVGNSEFERNKSSITKLYSFDELNSKDFLDDIILENINGFLPSPSIALFRRLDLKDKILDSILNSDNIDFNRTGAGPDVLFFLFTALKYPKIKFINEVLLYNRAHNESITFIENQSKGLKLSYDWAKYYFVKNYYTEIIQKYKSITLIRLFRYKFIHKSIWIDMKDISLDYSYLLSKFIF